MKSLLVWAGMFTLAGASTTESQDCRASIGRDAGGTAVEASGQRLFQCGDARERSAEGPTSTKAWLRVSPVDGSLGLLSQSSVRGLTALLDEANFSSADAGTYRCAVFDAPAADADLAKAQPSACQRLRLWPAEATEDDEAFAPMEVLDCPSTQTLREGRDEHVRCIPTGRPRPTATWYHNGSAAGTEWSPLGLPIPRFNGSVHGGRYDVVFVQQSEEGVSVHRFEAIEVRAFQPPRILSLAHSPNRVAGFRRMRLICQAFFQGQPEPIILWKINGAKRLGEGSYMELLTSNAEGDAVVSCEVSAPRATSDECDGDFTVSESVTFRRIYAQRLDPC